MLDRNRIAALNNLVSLPFWTELYVMKPITFEGDEEIAFFPTFLFFVACKGVLRHRCTLNAIVIQYLRCVQEMRWRLLCSVYPQL